jgi:hypothetical protein
MWPHFVNLLAESWQSVLSALSTSTLAIILFSLAAPVATFLVTLFVVSKLNAEKSFVEHLKQSVIPTLIGFAVPLILLSCVFGWKIVQTVYNDHEELLREAQELRSKTGGLVDPKSRDDEITQLKAELKTSRDELHRRDSPEVRIFQLSRGGGANLPKMEYILTTGKVRTPVEITVSCDFSIASFGANPLREEGGLDLAGATSVISASVRRIRIDSPPWSPLAPMLASVSFNNPVDRMPLCKFQIQ